jgi:hypothetical protein
MLNMAGSPCYDDQAPPESGGGRVDGDGYEGPFHCWVQYLSDFIRRDRNYALIPVVVAGVVKDIYDAWHPENHMAEATNVVATAAGNFPAFWQPVTSRHR